MWKEKIRRLEEPPIYLAVIFEIELAFWATERTIKDR